MMDARGDKIAPPALAVGALHPILINLDDLVVRRLRELGEDAHGVFVDLIIVFGEL
jgi:hypothetical protein